MSQSDYLNLKKKRRILENQSNNLNPVLESSQYTNFKAFNLETTVTNTKQTNSNLMQENKQRIYNMDITILDENSENCLPEFKLCSDTKSRPNRKPLKAFQSSCFPIMKAPGRSVPTYYNGSTLKKPEPRNCDCLRKPHLKKCNCDYVEKPIKNSCC